MKSLNAIYITILAILSSNAVTMCMEKETEAPKSFFYKLTHPIKTLKLSKAAKELKACFKNHREDLALELIQENPFVAYEPGILHLAAFHGNSTVVHYLLNTCKVPADSLDSNNITPLQYVAFNPMQKTNAYYKHFVSNTEENDIFRQLLQHGANPNRKYPKKFALAIKEQFFAIAQTIKKSTSITPLIVLCRFDYNEDRIIDILKAGANPHVQYGITALELYITYSRTCSPNVIKAFLERFAHLNETSNVCLPCTAHYHNLDEEGAKSMQLLIYNGVMRLGNMLCEACSEKIQVLLNKKDTVSTLAHLYPMIVNNVYVDSIEKRKNAMLLHTMCRIYTLFVRGGDLTEKWHIPLDILLSILAGIPQPNISCETTVIEDKSNNDSATFSGPLLLSGLNDMCNLPKTIEAQKNAYKTWEELRHSDPIIEAFLILKKRIDVRIHEIKTGIATPQSPITPDELITLRSVLNENIPFELGLKNNNVSAAIKALHRIV